MFLELRQKLAHYDKYLNPFTRPGAIRLSRYHPRSYTLLTAGMAAVGYLYLFLFPAILVAMPIALYVSVPSATTPVQWFLVAVEAVLLLLSAGVTWQIARLRFDPPSGLVMRRRNFPRLFELLDELGTIYVNARIDRVVLRDRFEIRVIKTPRNGLPFATSTTLVVGLPVLLTLSPLDVHTLIARRVGQLAGGESRLDSWMFFLRDMWGQYPGNCGDNDAPLLRPLCAFFRWYVPAYRALSLGIARRSELQADVSALRAINDRDAARGICAQAVVDEYLSKTLWPEIYACARSSVKPDMLPHARMAEIFQNAWPEQELRAILRRLEKRPSKPDSAMPCLARRLDNMGHRKALLPRPLSVNAARFYLGGACRQCVEMIDKRSSQKVRKRVIREARAGGA